LELIENPQKIPSRFIKNKEKPWFSTNLGSFLVFIVFLVFSQVGPTMLGPIRLDHADLLLDHADFLLDHADLLLEYADFLLYYADLLLGHADFLDLF
jgi:hypothetical protein